MKRTSFILLMTLFLITGSVTAQFQSKQGKPMNQEFRMYYEKNIKPVLIDQQNKFTSVLTDKEKTQLKQIKEQWKTVHETMKGKTPPEDRKATQKAHFETFNMQVEQIADAHPAEKEKYIKEMTPKKEQWQKDIKAIREKNNLPENTKKTYLDRVDDPSFILMWDPNRNMSQPMAKKSSIMQQQKAAQPGIRVFPQPASGTVTVKVTGVKDKIVSAGVYNAAGKKIKELFEAKSTIPALSFSFDVSKWENGTYTVKAKFGDRNMTMDFKVEKYK